jgi:hypothetical protein
MLGALKLPTTPTLSPSKITGTPLRHRFHTFSMVGSLLQAMLLQKFMIGLGLHCG